MLKYILVYYLITCQVHTELLWLKCIWHLWRMYNWGSPIVVLTAIIKNIDEGVPIVAQQKWIWLASMRIQVWPLASHSGLMIWHCHELWCRSQMWLRSAIAVAVVKASSYSSNSPLAWEPPYAMGEALKGKKKNSDENRRGGGKMRHTKTVKIIQAI